ncbi:5' nucleotidase, NT5C type [Polaribacter tangerinus]|uniref:5' nucleotidase, NT5C type n=1 Tax=Polaribacter tangerinus TaxID=1920034 RepID=UPI000B4B5965|nr:hypothetical protein [Polaribacter tangerinus]
MKKTVFIDMDGVIVDFGYQVKKINADETIAPELKKNPDLVKDVFKDPPPIQGAIDAIKKLYQSNKYNLFIATTAPWENPESLTHKRIWLEKYFEDIFKKKLFTTHRKDLLIGDFLIDDRHANGAIDFKGELLHFGWNYEKEVWNEYKNWDMILKRLL